MWIFTILPSWNIVLFTLGTTKPLLTIKMVPSARLVIDGSFIICYRAYDTISSFRTCLAHGWFIKKNLSIIIAISMLSSRFTREWLKLEGSLPERLFKCPFWSQNICHLSFFTGCFPSPCLPYRSKCTCVCSSLNEGREPKSSSQWHNCLGRGEIKFFTLLDFFYKNWTILSNYPATVRLFFFSVNTTQKPKMLFMNI